MSCQNSLQGLSERPKVIELSSLDFTELELDTKSRYSEIFNRTPQKSSDYSFVNLFSWNETRNHTIAITDDLAWIKSHEEAGNIIWGPVGDWYSVDWVYSLERYFPSGATFERTPEVLANLLSKELGDRIEISENRNEWEYIYSVEDLVSISGNKFHSKKNKLRQFEKMYDYEYLDVSSTTIEEILLMQKEWCEWRNCDGTPGLKAEHDAIIRVLGSWDSFPGLLGGVIHVDGRMVAYTIAEPISEDTLVIHFEKGMTEYQGIYQAINQKFLEANGKGFKWVNREQDMGQKGLRNAKRSYNPDHYLKKFRVKWKG